MDDVLIQNKYGEYRPLENQKVKASDETQLVYANGFLKAVNDAIDDIKHRSYFIGFRLDEANRCKYYEALGYANIEELAESEFGFKRSTTYGLMQAFNYAKSETPLYIADKFRGYSYTALLEMSKAKTIRGSGGIEKILTPKDSVSKIKEVRHYWNKYITDNGELPDCKTADEFLELVKKPAPVPLLGLAEHTEPQEQEENAVQSIGLTEPEETERNEVVECEFIETKKEPSTDFVDGEDYSQYDEEKSDLPKMTDGDLIDYCLKEGYGIGEKGKFEIYDFYYYRQPTRNLFLNFIKNKYGTGGHCGAGEPDISYLPSKGVTIVRPRGGKLELPWTYITGRINRLIESCEYLSADEHEKYLQWKADREGLIVNVDDGRASTEPEPSADVLPISDKEYDNLIKNLDELIKPKYKAKANLLNLKNEKSRRTWLDGFRSWGVWLEVKEVDKTFYRYNFANGAALIAEISAGYNDWYDGSVHEYERVEYSIIDDKHPKFNSHGISNTEVIKWLTAHAKEV